MFNVTVLKMKDIIKYLVGFTIIIFVVIYTTRYFSNSSQKEDEKISSKINFSIDILSNVNLNSCFDSQIAAIKAINSNDEGIEVNASLISDSNYLQQFLMTELIAMQEIDNNDEDKSEEKEENVKNNDTQEEEVLQTATTEKVQTEIVTPNAIAESYNVQYNNVKIKNQTDFTLTQEMLTPDIEIENKNVLIFHTHSCESYTPSEKYQYTQTGNFRSTDLSFTVTRVGTELENYLKMYNYNVIHDTSYHDYPAYSGSYTRSLQTVENILKSNSADIIIDLHRDAIGSRSDYAPTVKIGDDYAAQIMFVIGTNRRRIMASELE